MYLILYQAQDSIIHIINGDNLHETISSLAFLVRFGSHDDIECKHFLLSFKIVGVFGVRYGVKSLDFKVSCGWVLSPEIKDRGI